jgi:hypothetical protein
MSSALDVAPAPAPSSTDPGDCLDHLSCCRDDNVALCSADLTAVEWAARDAFTDPCVVCFAEAPQRPDSTSGWESHRGRGTGKWAERPIPLSAACR